MQIDIKLGGIIAAVILVIAILFSTVYTVPAGNRGVITTFGAVDENPVGEGIHIKVPFAQNVNIISVQTHAVKYENEQQENSPWGGDNGVRGGVLDSASKDMQQVQVSVTVNYRLVPDRVAKIYQTYNTEYQSRVVEPKIKEAVKMVTSQFSAEELLTNRALLSDGVNKVLSEEFAKDGNTIFEGVSITDIDFSAIFNASIEQKVTATQNALTAEAKLKQVEFEAQQQIERAKAEAETIRIQADAIQAQGGAEYVKLKWIDKWNGALPVTSLGSATPLINIGN